MCFAGHQPVQYVLPAEGNFPGGPGRDEGDRPSILGQALLWVAAHDGLAQQAGLFTEPEAGPALMLTMGLSAIYRRPRTSKLAPGDKVYPYLLDGMDINRPNQVWAADITYIPKARGFLYLVAIMDLRSRYVVAWNLSNTLEPAFVSRPLRRR